MTNDGKWIRTMMFHLRSYYRSWKERTVCTIIKRHSPRIKLCAMWRSEETYLFLFFLLFFSFNRQEKRELGECVDRNREKRRAWAVRAHGRTRSRSAIRAATALLARVRRIGTMHRRLRDGTSDCDSSSTARAGDGRRATDWSPWKIIWRSSMIRETHVVSLSCYWIKV